MSNLLSTLANGTYYISAQVEGTFIQFNDAQKGTDVTAWKYSGDQAQQVYFLVLSMKRTAANLLFAQWQIETDGLACTVMNVRYQTYVSLLNAPGTRDNHLQAGQEPYKWYIYDINGGHVCVTCPLQSHNYVSCRSGVFLVLEPPQNSQRSGG